MFHHRTLRRQISSQYGHGSVCADGFLKGPDNIGTLQPPFFQISVALVVESVSLKLFQIFSQGLSGNSHHIQVQHGLYFLHHSGNTACIVEELCRPFSGRSDIQQVMSPPVHTVKCVSVNLQSQLMGNGRNMKQGIG